MEDLDTAMATCQEADTVATCTEKPGKTRKAWQRNVESAARISDAISPRRTGLRNLSGVVSSAQKLCCDDKRTKKLFTALNKEGSNIGVISCTRRLPYYGIMAVHPGRHFFLQPVF